MQIENRFEMMKHILYPETNGKSLFNSVRDGTTIHDWSPNNLRRVIISESYIGVEWYVSAKRNSNSLGMLNADLNNRDLSSNAQPVLDLILKHNFGRQFSNIEEIVFCDFQHSELLKKDMSNFQTYVLTGYKHLMYISYVNESFSEVLKKAKDLGYGKTLTEYYSKVGKLNALSYRPSGDRTLTEIRTAIYTNSGNYSLDETIKRTLDTLESQYIEQQKSDRQKSIRITQSTLSRLEKKDYNGIKLMTMIEDATDIVSRYNTFSPQHYKRILQQCHYDYKADLGDVAKDILNIDMYGKDFDRPVVSDDTHSESRLLVCLSKLCPKAGVSMAMVTDQSLEAVIQVVLKITRSMYYTSKLIKTFTEKHKVIKQFSVTPCDIHCLKQYQSCGVLSDEDCNSIINGVTQILDANILTVIAKTSNGVILLKSAFSLLDKLEGEDKGDEEWDEDDDWDEDEDEDAESPDDNDESASTSEGIANSLFSTHPAIQKDKFHRIVCGRLGTVDKSEYDDCLVTSLMYLILYQRINKAIKVARPMLQRLIGEEINSPLIIDDQIVEIVNQYEGLTGARISCTKSLDFATKVTVDESKKSRGTQIATMLDIVNKVESW